MILTRTGNDNKKQPTTTNTKETRQSQRKIRSGEKNNKNKIRPTQNTEKNKSAKRGRQAINHSLNHIVHPSTQVRTDLSCTGRDPPWEIDRPAH